MGGRIRSSQRLGCAVCGSHEVERDEVLDAGVLQLAECARCRHRWTGRPLPRAAAHASADPELATAA